MRFELYYSDAESGVMRELSENEGFDPLRISALLNEVKEEQGVDFKIVDVTRLKETERAVAYEAAVKASVWNHYAIRKVFGTNKSSASFFGHGVPALIVYEGDSSQDVYPHERPDGRPATIRAYLENLASSNRKGEDLVKRMDELREAVGPVGSPASELIREGRRR